MALMKMVDGKMVEMDAIEEAERVAQEATALIPSKRKIYYERDRRMSLDFEFNGVMFQRDPVSIARINGAGTLALGAIVNGAQVGDLYWHGGADPFTWIASDNSLVTMDAQTCFEFGRAAAQVESTLVFAAKAIRAMDPIPQDFADDKWWP